MAGGICFSQRAIGVSGWSFACNQHGCNHIVVDAARRISGIAYIALLSCLAGCVPLGTPMVSEVSRTQTISGDAFIVRKGDTLYSIAWRSGKDYKELANQRHCGTLCNFSGSAFAIGGATGSKNCAKAHINKACCCARSNR